MKKAILILIIMTLPLILFAAETGTLTDSSTFTLLWNPEDSVTIGLTSEEPGGYGWFPSKESNASVEMGNVRRVGESIEVHNTGKLYAFCNAFFKQSEDEGASGTRFNVNISGTPFSLAGEDSVPFNITWSDGSIKIDGNTSETIFFYSDSVGVYSQQRELTINAELPPEAAGTVYQGTITLSLEVLT